MDKFTQLESIELPSIEIPNYGYGNGQNQLDAKIALRNLSTSSSGGLKIDGGSITITGTGNYTISGMSFQPQYIEFVFLMGDMAFGQGKCYSTLSQFSGYSVGTVLQAELTNTYSVYARSTEGNLRVRAKVTAINTDGFVLNNDFYNVYQTKVFYTCFG